MRGGAGASPAVLHCAVVKKIAGGTPALQNLAAVLESEPQFFCCEYYQVSHLMSIAFMKKRAYFPQII